MLGLIVVGTSMVLDFKVTLTVTLFAMPASKGEKVHKIAMFMRTFSAHIEEMVVTFLDVGGHCR